MSMASTIKLRMATMLAAFSVAASACQQEKPTVPLLRPTSASTDRMGDDNDDQKFDRIKHVVVIYLENHSFDNLYGSFPGANGLASAAATQTQVDATGNAFASLPMNAGSPFPTTLADQPFAIEDFVPPTQKIPDLVHRYYQE